MKGLRRFFSLEYVRVPSSLNSCIAKLVSHDTKDQFSVLFRREVVEDSEKLQEYRRLSGELREAVRMRDGYINELKMPDSSDEVLKSI
ncbi:hypothetical protein Tco_1276020 [Tanacetum coccineum]